MWPFVVDWALIIKKLSPLILFDPAHSVSRAHCRGLWLRSRWAQRLYRPIQSVVNSAYTSAQQRRPKKVLYVKTASLFVCLGFVELGTLGSSSFVSSDRSWLALWRCGGHCSFVIPGVRFHRDQYGKTFAVISPSSRKFKSWCDLTFRNYVFIKLSNITVKGHWALRKNTHFFSFVRQPKELFDCAVILSEAYKMKAVRPKT